MHPLEIVLLSVLAATVVVMAIPWSRRPPWLRLAPAIPLLLGLLQIALEGYRWQLLPAYALVAILFLIGLAALIRGRRPDGRSGRASKGLALVGALLGLVVVWFAVEAAVQVPVFTMPKPSGPYEIGTRTFLLVDRSRPDGESPLDNGYRTVSVQAWYPAQLSGDEATTAYLGPGVRQEMEALEGPPAWFFGYLESIQTNTHRNAQIVAGDSPFPVITYSPSGNASLHKILFEELASRGYVVVSISHPHWSNVFFDEQGAVIPPGGVGERYRTWFQEADLQSVRAAQGKINTIDNLRVVEQAQIALNANRPVAIAELREWAADVGLVLDQLAAMNGTSDFFAGRLDLDRVGVMGFSLGGATAGQFCATDPRCTAGINVDGFMFGDILDHDMTVPFMFFHSSRPGIQPVGVLFYERSEASAYLLQVDGASHGDLGAPLPTGRPILLPLGINLVDFPDGAHLARIMNDYIGSFFYKHLAGKPAPLLDGPSPYPEVTLLSKDGS